MTLNNLTRVIPVACVVVLVPLVLGFITWQFWFTPQIEALAVIEPNFFSAIKLEAKSAIVYDPETKEIIFAKNADEVLPIASITKLMTAHLANKNLTTETITTSDGKRWSPRNLIDFTLVTSSNDGAERLAAAVAAKHNPPTTTFPKIMNEEAIKLGLNNTHFNNSTGLDAGNGLPGGESTANEIAQLLGVILNQEPEIVSATTRNHITAQSLDGQFLATNTNTAVGQIPGLRASKTGFTRSAGGSLAVAVDIGLNEPVIVVVLGSSEDGRISDVEKLVSASIGQASQDKLKSLQ